MAKRVSHKLPKGETIPYAERPPQLIGGRLTLDFINTVSYRGVPAHERGDRLVSYCELVEWAVLAGSIHPGYAEKLKIQSSKRPNVAAITLTTAIVLRETLANLISPQGETLASELKYFNKCIADLPSMPLMKSSDGKLEWDFSNSFNNLSTVLWPILIDARELLTSENMTRIRTCSNEECSWVFLDLSRTNNRRWCSMVSCGNRHKASQHYQKSKAGG